MKKTVKQKTLSNLGLSLLELLMVITLVAALSIVSITGWQAWNNWQQKQLVIDRLEKALNFARQAAINQHQTIIVCAATNTGKCGMDWNNGIMIFSGVDNMQPPDLRHLLLLVPAFPSGGQLLWQGWLSHSYIQFLADGEPHSYHGSFYWGKPNHQQAIIIINAAGRIRLA